MRKPPATMALLSFRKPRCWCPMLFADLIVTSAVELVLIFDDAISWGYNLPALPAIPISNAFLFWARKFVTFQYPEKVLYIDFSKVKYRNITKKYLKPQINIRKNNNDKTLPIFDVNSFKIVKPPSNAEMWNTFEFLSSVKRGNF